MRLQYVGLVVVSAVYCGDGLFGFRAGSGKEVLDCAGGGAGNGHVDGGKAAEGVHVESRHTEAFPSIVLVDPLTERSMH